MSGQRIKLYQVGSFAVGNRLVDPEHRTVQARTERSNTLTSGHRACQGCGEALGARFVLDAAEERPPGTIFVIPARLEDCDVPERFRHWHWVDLFRRGGYARLRAAIEALGNKRPSSG